MQQGSSSESVEDTLDDLLREAAASDAAAEATRPSRAEEREIIAAGEALAFEKGVDPKTGKVVTSLTTKWDAFVAAHGEEYGFDAAKGPTPEFTRKFSSYGFFNRDSTSAVGHTGMGDSWGELQVPYLLPKYVFPAKGYPGWTTADAGVLDEQCRPFTQDLRAHWKRLKVRSYSDSTSSSLRTCVYVSVRGCVCARECQCAYVCACVCACVSLSCVYITARCVLGECLCLCT